MDRMTISYREKLKELVRSVGLRQVRLACGLVLFSYLVSHFLNHALGNISIEALEIGVQYHILFWQFLPVAIVLYTAAILHAALGIVPASGIPLEEDRTLAARAGLEHSP